MSAVQEFPKLTRRAKQSHNDIIAKNINPAAENPERVFHLMAAKLRMRFESDEPCSLQFRQI